MAELIANSVKFGDNTNLGGVPFSYSATTTNTISCTSSSWVNSWDTGNFSIPKGSFFKVLVYSPSRQDGGNWGGHYFRLYWQYNDDGTWRELGHSGYGAGDLSMSYNDTGRISHYENEFMFDFRDQASNFNIRFLFQHLSHTTTTYVNNTGQNNISDGDSTYTGTASNYRQKITIWGTGNLRA